MPLIYFSLYSYGPCLTVRPFTGKVTLCYPSIYWSIPDLYLYLRWALRLEFEWLGRHFALNSILLGCKIFLNCFVFRLLMKFALLLQTTDTSFLEKCHMVFEGNPLYVKPRLSAPEFSIIHYAGKVTYNVSANKFLISDLSITCLVTDVIVIYPIIHICIYYRNKILNI